MEGHGFHGKKAGLMGWKLFDDFKCFRNSMGLGSKHVDTLKHRGKWRFDNLIRLCNL